MDKQLLKATWLLFFVSVLATVHAADSLNLVNFTSPELIKSRVTDISTISSGDLSTFFLKIVFGAVSGLAGNNIVIGKVFELFNYGVLSIVSFTIGYSVLTSVIGSAQDAAGAFSSRVSPLTLARTVLGISVMTPMASGYSLVQSLVMKVVLLGIAFANTAWDATISYMRTYGDDSFAIAVDAPAGDYLKEFSRNFMAANYKRLFNAYQQECAQGIVCADLKVTGIDENGTITFGSSVNEDDNFKNTGLTGYNTILEKYDNVASYGELAQRQVTATIKSSLNIMLGVIKRHKEDRETKGNNSDGNKSTSLPNDLGEQEFQYIYSCPYLDNTAQGSQQSYITECPNESSDFNYISQYRRDVSNVVIGQGNNLESVLRSYPLPFSQEDEKPWYNLASKSGWLSAGIYYRELMNFSSDGTSAVATEAMVIKQEDLGKIKPISVNTYSMPQENIKVKTELEIALEETPQSETIVQSGVTDDLTTAFGNTIDDMSRKINEYIGKEKEPIDKRNELLPDGLSGRVAPRGWMYGVDPTAPIEEMAIMIRKVFINLVGKDGNDTISGTMYHTVAKPTEITNPIVMIQGLGKTMVTASVTYFSETIKKIYENIEKLAGGHLGASLGIGIPMAGIEAVTYGSPSAPLGVAAATASELSIQALKLGYNGVKVAQEIFIPVGTGIAAALFAMGVVMGVYIPMLPFVLFLFGAIAWLMSVAEAMVAAPLVALGMTHPEGHDLLGKSEQSLILLLGAFIRPIVMLFGMLMAIVVSQVLVKLFNLGFIVGVIPVFESAGDNLSTQGIVLCGTLLVYLYILMNIIEQSYSLIYVIPEKILRWVGGPQDQTGIGQLAEQAKGESQQAAQQVGSGAASSTSSPSVDSPDVRFSAPSDDSGSQSNLSADGDGGGGGDDGGGDGGDAGSDGDKSSSDGGDKSSSGGGGGKSSGSGGDGGGKAE